MQCPTPQKKRFPTWMDASVELSRALQTGRQRKLPQRIYKCPCGRFHLTSKPIGQQVVKPIAEEPVQVEEESSIVTKRYGRWHIILDGRPSLESFKTKQAAEDHHQKVLAFRQNLTKQATPEKWEEYGYE